MMIGKLVACGVPECLLGLGGGFMIRQMQGIRYIKRRNGIRRQGVYKVTL